MKKTRRTHFPFQDEEGFNTFNDPRTPNTPFTYFLQQCEEKAILHDLQRFLSFLEQFMTQQSITSLNDMGEKECLAFLKVLRNQEPRPIVDVEAIQVDE